MREGDKDVYGLGLGLCNVLCLPDQDPKTEFNYFVKGKKAVDGKEIDLGRNWNGRLGALKHLTLSF